MNLSSFLRAFWELKRLSTSKGYTGRVICLITAPKLAENATEQMRGLQEDLEKFGLFFKFLPPFPRTELLRSRQRKFAEPSRTGPRNGRGEHGSSTPPATNRSAGHVAGPPRSRLDPDEINQAPRAPLVCAPG